MSAAAPSDAVRPLMRDIFVLLQNSHETRCNELEHLRYDDESSQK
jgi:hypothetical protein